MCALYGTIDTGAVDRRLEPRLQHDSKRLRHWNRLRLSSEDAVDVRLDAIRGETLTLGSCFRAVRECLRIDGDLLPKRRHELRELAIQLGFVLGTDRDLGAVGFLQHHLALGDG